MRDFPGITALRALAACLVLVSHVAFWSGASGLDGVGPLLARGDAGVAIFFAISAFLLLGPAVHPEATWPPRGYSRKRFARIMPAYWAALLGVLAFAPLTASGLGGARKIVDQLLLVQGFTLDPYQGFTQTWSLTTEMTFYLIVPFIGRWLGRTHARATSPIPVLGVIFVIGILVQAWSATRVAHTFGAMTSSVLGHAAWFAVGAMILWWHRDASASCAAQEQLSPGRALGLAATGYVLVATPLGGPTGLSRPSLLSAGAKETLYAALAGLLLHAAACQLTGRARAVVRSGPVQRAGAMSYGVFLWHVLVIQVLIVELRLPLFHTSFLLVLIPTLVFSAALAWCSWRLLERPAIAWAHRRTRGQTSPAR